MGKLRDVGSGAGQGAALGGMLGGPLGAGLGAGLGGLGGYFGITPGSGGQDETKSRQLDLQKAQAMLAEQQRMTYGHRRSTMQGLGQMYGPANDRLARMYGQGARVQMPPPQSSPLDALFAERPAAGPAAPPMMTPGGRARSR